jgi:hypothetical protein
MPGGVAEMIVSKEERAALLIATEYFLGLAQIMPAHWIRPGVVAACIDLADRLGPKVRDEKCRLPGSTRAIVTKHLKRLGLRAPEKQREEA